MTILEQKAVSFLEKTNVVAMSSITENGYPRICAMAKLKSEEFTLWVSTGANSKKVEHYKNNPNAGILFYDADDSVTLNGVVEIIQGTDVNIQNIKKELWQDWLINHFHKGVDDPNFCVLKFTAKEAIIYIDGEFESFSY